MKTIIITIALVILSINNHAQCNPKTKLQIPAGYTLIRELKVDMLNAQGTQYYYFALKEKQEYQILIAEDPAYKDIVSYNLYEDDRLIGTNYNTETDKFYGSYNFVCQRSKDYKIVVSKQKNKKYCGTYYLLVKTNGQDPSTLRNEHLNAPEVFVIVEKMPIFKDGQGIKTFEKWVAENVKYPTEAREKGIKGRVYVQFVVSSLGKVMDATVIKSTNPILNDAALDVVESSPDWEAPGIQRGVKVNIQYVMYVEFE